MTEQQQWNTMAGSVAQTHGVPFQTRVKVTGGGSHTHQVVSRGDGGLRACETSQWGGQLVAMRLVCQQEQTQPILCSVTSRSCLECSLGGDTYTMETGKCYKPGPFLPLELIIRQFLENPRRGSGRRWRESHFFLQITFILSFSIKIRGPFLFSHPLWISYS